MKNDIEMVAVELSRKWEEMKVAARFKEYGISPRCKGCPESCRQCDDPTAPVKWECFKHPGPITRAYWKERHRRRLVGAGGAAKSKQRRGAKAERGPAPAVPANAPATNAAIMACPITAIVIYETRIRVAINDALGQ